MPYDIAVQARQLVAAAAWAWDIDHRSAPVELTVDDRMLIVAQGDERTAFDNGGERASADYLRHAPLPRPLSRIELERRVLSLADRLDPPDEHTSQDTEVLAAAAELRGLVSDPER